MIQLLGQGNYLSVTIQICFCHDTAQLVSTVSISPLYDY